MSEPQLKIALDNPEAEDVRELLARHLTFARKVTPPGHVHALEMDALKDEDISFYSARRGEQLIAIGALKRLDATHAEVKSMHTAEATRGQGAGEALLRHLLASAKEQGFHQVSLETGNMDAFAPARRLYQKLGFDACEPFGSYTANPFSICMRMELE